MNSPTPKSEQVSSTEKSDKKSIEQKVGQRFGFFEGAKSGRFPRPTNARPNMVRSGRNRQGKPC